MSNEETVEKIYDIEAVEGVAWFSGPRKLDVNQLSISEEAVNRIGEVLYEMRSGLKGAERALKGLLMRNESQTFMAYLQGNVLLLLEIDSGADIDNVYTKLRSQLGANVGKTKEPASVPAANKVQARAAEPEVSEVSVDEGLPVDLADFSKILISMLKKVSSSQLAKKMLAEGQTEAGISEDRVALTMEEAASLGTKVTDKIPNAARRKMLKKELQIALDKFQA